MEPPDADIEGRAAVQLLEHAYFRARAENEPQTRLAEIREAIELCLPKDWAVQRAAAHRLRGQR